MLVVSGPDTFKVQKEIGRNEPIAFSFEDAVDAEGNRKAYPDGEYTWQVRMVVDVKVLENPRHVPGVGMIDVEEQTVVRSGEFSVLNGSIAGDVQSSSEGGEGGKPVNPVQQEEDGLEVDPKAAIHHAGDVTITGDLCVGSSECATGYSPNWDLEVINTGNSAIRMTNDTTTPNRAWYIWVSDTQFNIEDATGGIDQVLVLNEGAPDNSIYVDSGGDLGLRTIPAALVDLHLMGPDANALIRLEETSTGSYGDIYSGNGYMGFGHYDSTNGYTEPFRIWKGAPENSLSVNAAGRVGLGVASPNAGLHMYRNDGLARVIVHEGNAVSALRTQFHMINNGPVNTQHDTGNATWRQQFQDNAYTLTKNDTGGNEMTIIAGSGDVTIRGSLFTGGPSCGSGCDAVLSPDFTVESIEDHASVMWSAGFLPAIGSTVPDEPINLTEKMGGVLNELEKAHIYIEQLHKRLAEQEALREAQEERLNRLEELLSR
jgi:hypothetical protein